MELTKVKNQAETSLVFSEIDLLNRAMTLAMFKLHGDANLINQESQKVQAVTRESLLEQARIVLDLNNCSTLYYHAQPKTETVAETAENETEA